MRRILSLFLALHWMIVFSALSLLCALDRQGGFSIVLHMVGLATPAGLPRFMSSQAVSTGFASGFGLVAVLFLWTLLTALFEDEESSETDEVARLAFGGAIGMVTILFLACAFASVQGFYAAVALELAALAGSWLAISAEKRMMERTVPRQNEPVQNAARLMALGAVHNSLLRRLQSQLSLDERRQN
ncbi:MAG TPA: hypothetical protein VHC00_19070 [Rhizobiaceae bacterium]|jgi:hypothetical protein|nr:hypothetical protein [Rhizobiaceae bacterium]